MTRSLNDLSDRAKPIFFEFLARLVEAGIPVMVIDVLRTREEQAENIRKGVSWTTKSKHLPDATGKSNAIDLCPFEIYALHGADKLQWNASDDVWEKIGVIGEKLGLEWGGRWTKARDMGHFQDNL